VFCCNKKNEKCIDPRRVLCSPCDAGLKPCGKKCCPKGHTCCDSNTGLCCKTTTQTCTGFGGKAKCCPKGTKACEQSPGNRKAVCCDKGETCAQIADPSGTVPVALLGKQTCCPPERTVPFGGGNVTCCPPGYRSLGGRFVLPAGGGGGLCCRDDKLCGARGSETCCGANADPGIDQTCCNGTCTSLFFDGANCGACGNACPPGTRCAGGTCVPG
jgi:hypothetical protein